MGRIFQTQQMTSTTQTIPTGKGGRIFGAPDNPHIESLKNSKSWEQMSFGEKIFNTAKELPKTLYNFIPPSIREMTEAPPSRTPIESLKKFGKGITKGIAEFGLGLVDITTQAVGGAILSAKQKITGKPESVKIPVLPEISEKLGIKGAPAEISSYQKQAEELRRQGFSKEESRALVGINAYLGIMPFASKAVRSRPGQALLQKATTKEVIISETKFGQRQQIVYEANKFKPKKELQKHIIPENVKQELDSSFEFGKMYSEFPKNKLYKSDGKTIQPKMAEGRIQDIAQKIEAAFPYQGLGEAFKKSVTAGKETFVSLKKMAYKVLDEGTMKIERPTITKLKSLFGKTKPQKEFSDIMEKHLDKYFEGREILVGKEDLLNQALLKLNNKELKTYSNITQGLVTPAQKPSLNLKNAIDLWKKTNKEIEVDLIARKKLTPEQVENRRWKPIEIVTGRSREELKQFGVEPVYYPYLAEDLLKKSDFIATTGKRTKGGYLKRFTGKLLQEDNYIKDPRIAIPRHRVQVFRDKMNTELVESIKSNFAEQDKAVIKQYQTNPRFAEQMGVTEWKPAGTLRFYPTKTSTGGKAVGVTKKVESYWIPKEIGNELNKIYKPGIFEKSLRMTYDPLINMWRVSVLNLAPRWLYNNVVGNTVLSMLGKTDPFAFGKSAKEMFARTKLGKRLEISQREIPKGVFVKEYAGGEIGKAGRLGSLAHEQTQFLNPLENWMNLLNRAAEYKALRIPAVATQNLIKGFIGLGKPIGLLSRAAENWFRGAMYISKTEGKFLGMKLDKPVPPVEGIKYVNEFLFNYSKLTRKERATFRRALPFWNWQKNITEFSFKFPAKHPLRGLIVGALLQDYVDYINETNQKSDKVKSVLRLKTGMVYDGKPLYLNIKSAIPFSDVFNNIPTGFRTGRRFLTSNPVSKILLERVFKVNAFTGQPFTQPKAMQEFDEFGKPILPVPSLGRHIGMQLPQVKIGREIKEAIKYKGKVIKRYDTGEPKIVRNQIQTENWLLPIMRYFGVNLSAVEYNKIEQSKKRKERKQGVETKRYEQQTESGLKRLKSQ